MDQIGKRREVPKITHRVQDRPHERTPDRAIPTYGPWPGHEAMRNGNESIEYYPGKKRGNAGAQSQLRVFPRAFTGVKEESARNYVISRTTAPQTIDEHVRRSTFHWNRAMRCAMATTSGSTGTVRCCWKRQIVTRPGEVPEETWFRSVLGANEDRQTSG